MWPYRVRFCPFSQKRGKHKHENGKTKQNTKARFYFCQESNLNGKEYETSFSSAGLSSGMLRRWAPWRHDRTSTVARSNRFGRAIPAPWLLFPCWHPSPPPWFIGGPTRKTKQRCSGMESPPFEQGTVTVSHHQITLPASLEKIRRWVKRPGRLGGNISNSETQAERNYQLPS